MTIGWNDKLFGAARDGHTSTIKQLIEQGADVNAKIFDGWTPLHEAARHGHTDTVKQLIAHGADVNTTTTQGITPLLCATNYGHSEIVKLLEDAIRKQPGFAAREQDCRAGPSNEGRG